MITNKLYDYLRFRETILSNVIARKDLPEYIRFSSSKNSVDYTSLRFFF
jgi:hypothetical protein